MTKKDVNFSQIIYGKVPPHSKEIEISILGIMLESPDKVIDIKSLLSVNDFYLEEHRIVYKAILDVSEYAMVDMKLVGQLIHSEGNLEKIGGLYFLVELTNKLNPAAFTNYKKYCSIILEKSILRSLTQIGGDLLSRSVDETEDVFSLLDDIGYKIKTINNNLSEKKIVPLANVAMNIIEKFDTKVYNAKNNIVNPNEVYTRIPEWDRINGSLFNGLYVVAGRPAMGKGVHLTELACRMGREYEIGIINGEMSNEQLLTRIGCNLMGIDNFLWKKDPSTITEQEQQLVRDAMEEALSLKLHIDENREIGKIANKIRLWVEKYGVKCVFVDFLTILKISDELAKYFTETQKVNYILDILASLCKELKIPIILYVQMNRGILGRTGDREPNLGDLKASGSIEELAFQVSFLHRPEYYDPNNFTDEHGESTKGLMYQIIAKHRDGEVGRIKHKAILQCSQLKSWNSEPISGWKPTTETPF
jgi:replicative DNA helicase